MDTTSILRKYAGQWVAWNRQQDRVISSGRTFEEAKQSAAAAGESSVILTKASEKGARRPHWLCAVAVFIALAPGGVLPAASPVPCVAAQSASQRDIDDLDDATVDLDQAEGDVKALSWGNSRNA